MIDAAPPQSGDMELSVLGACLVERWALQRAAAILRPQDFYNLDRGFLFRVMIDMDTEDEVVDLFTIQQKLRNLGEIDRYPGAAWFHELPEHIATTASVEFYAQQVKDKAVLRGLESAGRKIVDMCHSEYDELHEVTDKAEMMVREAVDFTDPKTVDMKTIMNQVYEELEKRSDNPGVLMGISTGIPKLDYITGGIRPGNLVVIGARPGTGKSAIALNIARHVAANHGTVIFFSLEMGKDALGMRLLASDARVDGRTTRTGNLGDAEWGRVGTAAAKLSDLPIYICDDSSPTVMQMKSNARRLGRNGKLAAIMVDYLQLVEPHKKADSRAQEVGQISRALKAMARELDCPVFAMAQLNRESTKRATKKPTMADLRESGDIEADADMVWLLYVEEAAEPDDERHDGPVDLIVEKHRDGPRGVVPLWFKRGWARFEPRTEFHQ